MKTKEDSVFQTVGNIIMLLFSAAAVMPIILLTISSFTDNASLVTNGYSFVPAKWSIEAYRYIFKVGNGVVRAYGVSILLTVAGTGVSLVMTTMLAYALSRPGMPGRSAMMFFVFFTLLFNGGLVPTYINYTNVFHIKNTFWALMIPSLMLNAFNVLLMKSYFVSSVPYEILEAAFIDGAGEFTTFIRVSVPMSKPIIATVAMFSGIAYWNDWNNGYIYLSTATELYSIQNLLNRMIQNIQFLTQNAQNLSRANEGIAKIPTNAVRMAMAVIGVLPVIIVYPFIQNSFVKGITLGGVKG